MTTKKIKLLRQLLQTIIVLFELELKLKLKYDTKQDSFFLSIITKSIIEWFCKNIIAETAAKYIFVTFKNIQSTHKKIGCLS